MTENQAQAVLGDCLLEMPKMEAGSVDLLVTDPPYGLSFMGKDWDRAVPSVDVWKAALRVLKPAAFAFIMISSLEAFIEPNPETRRAVEPVPKAEAKA